VDLLCEVGLGRVVTVSPVRGWLRASRTASPARGWPWASHDLGLSCLGKVGSVFSYDPFLLKRLGTLEL
jgi:hypothetical protein